MQPSRWQLLQEKFHQASELDPDEQQRFLSDLAARDPDMARELKELLKQNRPSDTSNTPPGSETSTQTYSAEKPELKRRTKIGPYILGPLLGEGGMGSVFQARHEVTKQIVAIKVLRAGSLSLTGLQRFATEQKALAELDHPLIARLFGSEYCSDGTPCFVMEYVDGLSLTAYCADHSSSARDRILLFRQVCQAVQYAHSHLIIHRDLKPANIFVKNDGTIRLLDFGISKKLDEPEDLSVSNFQAAPMSICYAAPEQLARQKIGTYTDTYALGVTLFQLLSGELPFQFDKLTPGEAEIVIRSQAPARLTQTTAHPSEAPRDGDWSDLELICTTAMHKDPQRRYATVESFIDDLDRWLGNRPIHARPDSLAYRTKKFVVRNSHRLAIAATLMLFITAGAIWFTVTLAEARDQAVRRQTETARIGKFTLSLFDNGDPHAGPVQSATALTMLDRGRKEAQLLGNDPDFQTELYNVLGDLYHKLGKFEASSQCLQAALRNEDTFGAIDKKTRSKTLLSLGLLKNDQSQFPEAERLIRQASRIVEGDRLASEDEMVATQAGLAVVFLNQQNFKAALPLLESALSRHAQGPEIDNSEILFLLGEVYREAGEFPKAIEADQRAMNAAQQQYGDAHPLVARDLSGLASAEFFLHRFAQAEVHYNRALKIYDGWYGKDHPSVIETREDLAQVQNSEGKTAAARASLQEVVAAGRQVLGDNDDRMLFALNVLGTLDQHTGHYDAARAEFTRLLNGARVTHGQSGYLVGVALNNLALLDLATQRYQEAVDSLQVALKILAAHLAPDHPDVARIHLNLGKALWYLHRYAEAQIHLQMGLDVLDKLPNQPGLTEAHEFLDRLKRSPAKPRH